MLSNDEVFRNISGSITHYPSDINYISGTTNVIINNTQLTKEQEEHVELGGLLYGHVSKDALHDSFHLLPDCHPNTRRTVRGEIAEWIDDRASEKSPLLWLNGPAGVGKSVIAKTIAESHDWVVATFFFSISSDRTAATLLPTLAWQLARKIPETRQHIIASLKSEAPLTSQIEKQFELLITWPLNSSTRLSFRPVMVIDGIDECIDEHMLLRFLRVLVRASEHGNMPCRFIICSRPDPRIHAMLGRTHDVIPTTDEQVELASPNLVYSALRLLLPLPLGFGLHHRIPIPRNQGLTSLQEVWDLYRPIWLVKDKGAPSSEICNNFVDTLDKIYPHPVVSTIQLGFSEESKEDIRRYFIDQFSAIRQSGADTGPWFQPRDISDLVEASSGQFLYASTIVRLLDDFDPSDVLEMAHRGSLPTPDLNRLYRAISKRAHDTIQNQAQEGGPNYQMERRFLMDSLAILVFFAGNVHLFRVRKSFPVIESLLGLERGKLTKKLRKMHSVLSIIPGESIQVRHRSFLEFLQSRERSGEYHIGYSKALGRILILMVRAGLRYHITLFRGQLK